MTSAALGPDVADNMVNRMRQSLLRQDNTPAGVGQVRDGQHITVEITRVGRLPVRVTSDGAVACLTLGKGHGPVPPS